MRIMRVSLTVGAVVAAAVATGGTAVAAPAAKSLCYVVAKKNTDIRDVKTGNKLGTLKKNKSRDSACSPVDFKEKVVLVDNGKNYVLYSDVSINARA